MRIAKTRKVNNKFKLIMLGIFLFLLPIGGPLFYGGTLDESYSKHTSTIVLTLMLLQIIFMIMIS